MIKAITVTTEKNETLRLELSNPDPAGIYIKKVTGITPDSASIMINEQSSADGGSFSFARREARDIDFELGLMFSPMIEDARHRIYHYFGIKKKVVLGFETDYRNLMITGYVAKCEVPPFDKAETAKIRVTCPDPWFYDRGNDKMAFYGVMPEFEFPFSNESLDEPLIEFGDIRIDTRASLWYTGDVDTGIVIHVNFLGPARGLRIYNTVTREAMIVDDAMVEKLTGGPLTYGVELIISTVTWDKYATILKGGEYFNAMGVLNRDADWFELSSGDNIFAFSCEDGRENIQITFSYKNKYGGV